MGSSVPERLGDTPVGLQIGALALLGPRIPQSLRVFMLSLAIVDDIGAILVVAIGYSSHIDWRALALGAVGIAVVRAMTLVGIRGLSEYSPQAAADTALHQPLYAMITAGSRRSTGLKSCATRFRQTHFISPVLHGSPEVRARRIS